MSASREDYRELWSEACSKLAAAEAHSQALTETLELQIDATRTAEARIAVLHDAIREALKRNRSIVVYHILKEAVEKPWAAVSQQTAPGSPSQGEEGSADFSRCSAPLPGAVSQEQETP